MILASRSPIRPMNQRRMSRIKLTDEACDKGAKVVQLFWDK